MEIKTHHVKGKGRGKLLGFPTINLEIPKDLDQEEGIYASRVKIAGKKYLGALHFGPVPTFDESDKTLEVFLIDTKDQDLDFTDQDQITVEFFKKIREIRKFNSENELSRQIGMDVAQIKSLLRE